MNCSNNLRSKHFATICGRRYKHNHEQVSMINGDRYFKLRGNGDKTEISEVKHQDHRSCDGDVSSA